MDNISDKGKTSSVRAEENLRRRGRVCRLLSSWVLPGWAEIPRTRFARRSHLGTTSLQVLWPRASSTLKHTLNFQHIYTTIEVSVAVCMLKIKYMLKLAWDQRSQRFVGPVLAGAWVTRSCNLARAFPEFRIGPKEFLFPGLEGLQGSKLKVFWIFIVF